MKHGFLVDSLSPPRNPVRRRAHAQASSRRPDPRKPERKDEGGLGIAKALPETSRLVLVESEGAVFDSLAFRHEHGYLPAFIGRFAWGADPSLCARIWRKVALHSRLRGEDPEVLLPVALRLLNSKVPSVRRAAVARSLEVRASASGAAGDMWVEGEDPAWRLARDWLAMAEGLLRDAGQAAAFGAAREFLSRLASESPRSDVLVYSRLPEALALHRWEMAGMGRCFGRIAGRERGDMTEYLRSALDSGYDVRPMLVIGSCRASWLAAQASGARFYPIIPGREEESWNALSEGAFSMTPAGSKPLPRGDFSAFLEIGCAEPSVGED